MVPVNRVLIDYLTIHFFSNQHLKLIEAIIGMPIERFEELDYAPKGYIGQYVWNQVITIRYSIDDTVKGTVMEFSGQGCKHLAMRLKTAKSNWQEFFRKVLDHQGNFTRIDFTLDDFVGSLSIPELKRKVTLGHVWTTFQVSESHGGTDIINNGFNLYRNTCLNPSHLIVEKSSRIGKISVIPMIFRFISLIQEHLLNED